jgi:Type IV secretory pathway, VirB3-like protein
MRESARAPIRAACWRVHLVGGVDRTLFWWIVLGAVLASGIAWFAGVWYLALGIIPGTAATLELCRRATEEDPMAPKIWLRWVFEPRSVAAVGRLERRSVGARRRR